MSALQVEIVTPEKSVFSGEVTEIVVPGWDGQLGVLAGHDALLSLLKCGVATLHTPTGKRAWVIGRGFADIGGTHVTLLTDQAVDVNELDKASAATLLTEAEAEMKSDSIGSEGYRQAQTRAEWAQAILDA